MLKRMGKNHGFHANVVNRVYRHLSGLQEADKILHVMQEVVQE